MQDYTVGTYAAMVLWKFDGRTEMRGWNFYAAHASDHSALQ